MKINVITAGNRRQSDLMVTVISRDEFTSNRGKPSPSLTRTLKRDVGERALEQLARQRFESRQGQTALFTSANGGPTHLLIGMESDRSDSSRERLERLRNLGAQIEKIAEQLKARRVEIALDKIWVGGDEPLEAFWEGLVLSHYQYRRYKTDKKRGNQSISEIYLVTRRKLPARFAARMQSITDAVAFARDLINTPPNDLRPGDLARECRSVSKASRLSLQLFDKKKLEKMGAWGILCVGLGSDDQSYLAKITYKPKSRARKSIALVGKAITFDTGGLSIKTSMDTMKCDMSGGAAVLATMKALSKLDLPVAVTAYIPIAENMINGHAMRPGDVFTLLSGKTVEVLNTDAEGRLILSDALHLARMDKHDMIIDLATLTGACAAALGSKYAGIFCNNRNLAELIQEAADISGEPLWELPLAREYRKLIYSDVADYKNLFKDARAITAALFLEEFVGGIPWAHLDIAGPAFTSSNEGAIKAGGVGFGVRTLIRFLESVAG